MKEENTTILSKKENEEYLEADKKIINILRIATDHQKRLIIKFAMEVIGRKDVV